MSDKAQPSAAPYGEAALLLASVVLQSFNGIVFPNSGVKYKRTARASNPNPRTLLVAVHHLGDNERAVMITQQYIKELFHYNEHTGDFTRLIKRGSSHVGDIAGSITWNGYTSIYIDGKNYRAHQLAWLYVHGVWPDTDIDHINRNKSDNRIVNLRLASRSQNNINSGLHSHNTSGFRGVYASRNKWAAQIKLNGKKIYLGRFNTAEEAHQCYLAAARELYGEFVQQKPA